MRQLLLAAAVQAALTTCAAAHGVGSTPITWNREVSRLVYDKCASCHRPEGTAFSLMTYVDAQPRANEIKDAVLSRRMPPWGGIRGFGSFRNDQSLTQEQIELIVRWVDGGLRRGNNPAMLPKAPLFAATAPSALPESAVRVEGFLTLRAAMTLDGLLPEKVPPASSIRVVAVMPGGRVAPLVWLYQYDNRHAHPFLLRTPIYLPEGTRIEGLPGDSVLTLIPTRR